MIFLDLFLTFTKIGTFNFGGGYAMLSLIHNETVVKNHWLTNAEFTDIVAIQGGRIKMRSPPKVLTGNFRPSQLSFFLS